MEQKQWKKVQTIFFYFITIPHFPNLHHLISIMIKVKEFSAPITKITGYQLHLFNFSHFLELSVTILHHKIIVQKLLHTLPLPKYFLQLLRTSARHQTRKAVEDHERYKTISKRMVVLK